ncbi:hypothetical protein [Arenibaculum pallidiluteum]|uniref:hypothetical protein n=1 Tax=Arenibaculum pallidiluteum TaxID=2812559 RepID=UPI001A96C9B7|nr:hypothetical protein [Arenibaculum pallidiluteum]
MSDDEKRAWVERVLDYPLDAGSRDFPTAGAAAAEADTLVREASDKGHAARNAAAAWREAIGEADAQFTALASVLRSTDDDELHYIADLGLDAVFGEMRGLLTTALTDLQHSPPDRIAAVAGKAADLAMSLRKHIEADARIRVCDTNPFGVTLTLGEKLGQGLRTVETTLAGLS